jgi:hypothetical protein
MAMSAHAVTDGIDQLFVVYVIAILIAGAHQTFVCFARGLYR